MLRRYVGTTKGVKGEIGTLYLLTLVLYSGASFSITLDVWISAAVEVKDFDYFAS